MTSIRNHRGRTIFVISLAPALSAGSIAVAAPAFVGITTGAIQNASITEASGIAASRINPNVLWTHEDSGAGPQVYAITPAGVNLGTYTITGAGATDWEDIAVGPGPTAGTNYLYAGDIGDNNAVHTSVAVYRVPEPTVSDTQSSVTTSLSNMAKLTFVYPDGPRDAESLFVDPLSKDIYIISKRDMIKHVYRAAYPQSTSSTTTLELVATLNNANFITAADISPDGSQIIMRAGAVGTGLMYTRAPGATVANALATTPISIPLLSEVQGEAIGFDAQGRGYFTTSEGASAPIHYFNLLPPPASAVYWDSDGVTAGSRSATGAGTGGSGIWNAAALNWYNGSADVAWAGGNDAVFWGTAGTVTLAAAQAVNSLTFKANNYVVAGAAITLSGSSINVDPPASATINSALAGSAGLVKNGAGTLTLGGVNTYTGATNIAAGTLILNKSLTSGAGVSINSGATLILSSGAASVLKTSTLSIAGSGKLDLKDNKLIATGEPVGTWDGAAYTGVAGQIQSGRNGGSWTGAGIVTTEPAAATSLTTLGVASASQVKGIAATATTTWAGQTVSGTDTLMMYTYAGDATLDGKIDVDDYTRIDFNSPLNVSGWYNGDFNYDGKINVDDYTIIDFNVGIQGTPFSSTSTSDDALGNASAVPEPASSAFVLLGARSFLGTRRRRSHSTRAMSDV